MLRCLSDEGFRKVTNVYVRKDIRDNATLYKEGTKKRELVRQDGKNKHSFIISFGRDLAHERIHFLSNVSLQLTVPANNCQTGSFAKTIPKPFEIYFYIVSALFRCSRYA